MRPITFLHDGQEIYTHSGWNDSYFSLPRVGEFVTLHLRAGLSRWRVQAVEWQYEESPLVAGEGRCLEPAVLVHLRRLRPGEWGNRDEPRGYDYLP